MRKGWQTKPLGDVLEVQNGYAFDSKGFNSSKGMPLIRIRSLKAGTETETRYSGDYDKKYVVDAGDLLIGMDGEFGCYEWNSGPALLNQRVCRIQGFDSQLLPRFLFYGVNSHLKAIEDVTGFATVKHLSSKQILKIEFPLPPLTEQQRIVGILDEAFEGLATAKANAEKNLQNARALFENHLQFVFTQPHKGWVKTTVKEIAAPTKGSIRTGPFGSQLLHSEFVDKGIAVLGIDNAVANEFRWGKSRFITPEKYRQLERYRVHPGDVLITIMGTCGRCAIVPDDIPTAINTKHICCITLNRKKCLPGYLHIYFLHAPQAQEFLAKHAKGAIMAGLNMGLIQELPVMLPPTDVQEIIVEAADALREETQRLANIYEHKLAALEALKKSMLHQAFAGNL
jgi:type I restriction enzyme S subunit